MEYMQCTDEDALSHDEAMLQEGEEPYPSDEEMESSFERMECLAVENAGNDRPVDAEMEEEVPRSSQDDLPPAMSSQGSEPPEAAGPSAACGIRARSIASVRIPDSLSDASRFPLQLDRYLHPAALLMPDPEHLKSIESQSKSLSMVAQQDHPIHAGVSWSFVDYCAAPGLSQEMLKVLYFFATMNGLANNYSWNGYVVPTEEIECSENIKLKPLYAPNKKDIRGVLQEQNINKDSDGQERGDESIDSILLADDGHEISEGDVRTSLPFFSINVGFTASLFKKEGSTKDEIALFGVVTVTSLMNVRSLEMILVSPILPFGFQ